MTRRLPRRSLRVAGLVGIVLVLSLVDLLLTLIYATQIGLIEDNPLARAIMHLGGPWLVIAWKVLTVGFAAGVLIRFRRRGVAEIAAVVCAAVMTWLTVHWFAYIDTSAQLTAALHEMEFYGQGHWVTMADAPEAP
ncbi:MAG: hypothetical protein IPJ41_01345 [Phycisphaerales bacterium]|nr:hypothetical protein [Phycisphaerales bacterium]